MFSLRAAARIVYDSFSYRLRAREANNLAVTATLMVAFRLPHLTIAARAVYALLLNVYVYLINDYCDIDVDLASGRRPEAVGFLAEHRGGARVVLAVIGIGLIAWAFAAQSLMLLLATTINSLVVYTYSAWLKRVVIVDLLLMAVSGAAHALIGLPLRAPEVPGVLGIAPWVILVLIGLLSSGYQVIQVIRDEPSDRAQGVRTTAVVLGSRGAAWVFRAIMASAALYGWLLLGSTIALGFVVGALLPLSAERAARTWDIVRAVAGVVWLGLMAQIYLGWWW